MHKINSFIRCAGAGLTIAIVFAGNPADTVMAQQRSPDTQAPPIPDTAIEPQGFIGEPGVIERAVVFMDRHFAGGDMTNGFYADTWSMIPGSGWISIGPGYRRWSAQDRVFVNASAAISWHGYKTAQARIELPRLAHSRLAVGSQFRWQDLTHVDFFGEGAGTTESNRSAYRIKSTNLVGYATLRPLRWLAIGTQIGWLEPSILSPEARFKSDQPNVRALFPSNFVFRVPEQPTFVHTEASITADTRDFPGHTIRGWLYRGAITDYSDRDAGFFSFRRYEAEAAHFVPLAGSRVVLALHGWLVGSDTDEGDVVPFYLQPSLGGHNSLRGYTDYRFHDRNLLLVNAEARVALMTHVDAAVFFDAGNVAGRMADLNLDKRALGVGLRVHSRRQTFARLDMAHGDEGWRVFFRLTDPLNLARLSRRTASVPFVP
jgi:Omp85 superfamily domain